jgi:membrane protease YdiL (CAAX protease family)
MRITDVLASAADAAAAPAAPAPTPTTLPQVDQQTAGWAMLAVLFFTGLALGLIVKLRVLRPRSIMGPNRRPAHGRLWTIAMTAAVGFCAWQFASALYLSTLLAQWKAAGIENASQRAKDLLTPKDYAYLATIPPMIAFFVMLGCNGLFAPGNLTAMGTGLNKLLRGVGIGVVSFLIIGPMMFWVLTTLELVYRAVHYKHPMEHALLKSLGEAQESQYAAMLALGATLVAPLLEELLFRGHLQTFIRQWLAERSWRRQVRDTQVRDTSEPALGSGIGSMPLVPPPPPLLPPPIPSFDAAPPVLPYMAPPLPPPRIVLPPPLPRPWHGWVAILITSVFFAAMHEAWTAPAIFVLSLALGYVYERSGNLWASMTVHMLFNTLSTLQFMLLMHGGR